ncbi:MAG: lipopolysaccharide assembly protein LapA domain-containing protein [Candidatus Omnitrophica bacterium]|nr:lipopolysaccharide assembly protein LapA domain-containing protein [Candidatus Omnitrophota bacterium]
MNWKLILAVILLIFLSIFAMQNYEVVTVKFLVWSFQTSIAIMTFSALLIGIIIGFISCILRKKKAETADVPDPGL